MTFSRWDEPPIGSGGYAQWVIFVVVIILAVALAEWLLAVTVGKR